MITARLVGFLLPLCLFTSLPAVSIQKDDPLLEESYNLSQKLGSGREQLYYLIEFCRVDALNNRPWEKTKEAALALFRLASTEQNMQLHAVAQKNGVTCLSYVDPVAAMELLTQINFERPRPGEWAYEDPRYNSAQATFNNLLVSLGKIPPRQAVANIIAKARFLGQTGQYPYLGVADVINRLPTSFKSEQNTLLNDATTFYASETGFYNRDEEFFRLLQTLNSASVDRTIMAQALTTFAHRLTSDPIHFPGDYYAEIEIKSNGRVFPFTDRNDAFLFQAFPLIQRFIPGKAPDLRQQNAKLAQATGNMTYVSGGFVQGNPTSEQAIQQHLQWMQESLIERIEACQDSNPQVAASLAQRLTELTSRIVGFSATVPGIARTNLSAARNLYDKQISDLGNLGNSVGKLRAMVALTSAAYHVGDSVQYESLSTQALDMGIRFFDSDVQAGRVGRREGFSELRDLIISTASLPSDILKIKVQNLPDSWLKNYLLLYEAAGHTQMNSPPTASKSCTD